MNPMKLYVIAGEPSGDLHGANLLQELKRVKPSIQVRAWGGDKMKAQGAEIVKHIDDLAFMGFAEVIANLPAILRNFSFCKRDIQTWGPDAVILIDYPGFNLRMARFIHHLGIPVIYYISPQIWAWKESRVNKIRKYVDKMLVILPFEQSFYQKHGMKVEFIGNPLLDVTETFLKTMDPAAFRAKNELRDKPIVALLPGSRKQEISAMLPIMGKVAAKFPEYEFTVARVPWHPEEFYLSLLPDPLPLVADQTYDLLSVSEAALVTSGTATLETALLGTPQVVCYKANAISYAIARKLVKIKFISLVNLIMDKEVVRELIQHDLNEKLLTRELQEILPGGTKRETVLANYTLLKQKLGGAGASAKAARSIVDFLDTREQSI